MMATLRDPCPGRIIDDFGGSFFVGAVGGAAFHFPKGIYSCPRGERLVGAIQAVRMNAPRVGGRFAVWRGLHSTLECTMAYLRRKEDPWNPILAGAATGGFLKMRRGLGAVSRSALLFGGIFALIEGSAMQLNKMMNQDNDLVR